MMAKEQKRVMPMVLKATVAASALCFAKLAAAQEVSVLVDPPVVCMTKEAVEHVVRYYFEGGIVLVQAWVAEHTDDCFSMSSTPVPSTMEETFVTLVTGKHVDYGYIPVTAWGIDFYMFFVRLKVPSIPT